LQSLDQPDPEVQIAALTALIASAVTHDVSMLAHRASTAADPRVRDAAFETLRLMSARGTNQAIHALMAADKCADPVIVRCALARRAAEFVPAFLEAAESSHEAVRLAAFEALEVMATAKEAEAIAGLLCKTSPGAEREAASRAVWTSCQEIADPAQRPAPLLAALAKANPAQQCAILPALARFGGERALEAVHAAMQDTDQALRDAGYRALANWPDAAVANELLHIAQTSTVESYRVWSLRAYARVVSLPNPRPPEKTCEMLSSALHWATRAQDKELIISRLGSVRSPDALSLLLSLVDNPKLQRAAVPAVFTLAKGLSQSHPEQATAALETIRARTNDQAILQQIPKVLRDIKTREER